jgi:hypothetical protein
MRGSLKSNPLGGTLAFALGLTAVVGGASIWSREDQRQVAAPPPSAADEDVHRPAGSAGAIGNAVTSVQRPVTPTTGAQVDPPPVPVPSRLAPFQALKLDQPGSAAALQHALTGLLTHLRPGLDSCLPPPGSRTFSRLECYLQVTTRPHEAETTGARCGDVAAGAPLAEQTTQCIERALGGAAVLSPAGHHRFPDSWEGELPVQVDIQ